VVINPDESRTAIVKLSELLRFTLQYGKERLISVEDEIQEVTKYLELELLRFGERLQVRYQIAAQSRNLSIPPAMVLTLAENAIKHGVAKHIGIGIVEIVTWIENNDWLFVRVINSGDYHPENQHGIGLQHIHKRLDEIYNGRAGFTIESKENKVFATLQIPLVWQ
jgi:two-component system LytT family sensor kinase